MITPPTVKRKQPTPSKPSSTKVSNNVLSKDEQRKLKRIRNADADMVRIVEANKARLTLDPDNNPAIAQRDKILHVSPGSKTSSLIHLGRMRVHPIMGWQMQLIIGAHHQQYRDG
jgi:hypothetical protein